MAHLTFLRIALLQFKREFTTALSKRTGYKTAPNNDGDMNNRECCAMFEIDGTQYKEIHTSFFLVSKYDVWLHCSVLLYAKTAKKTMKAKLICKAACKYGNRGGAWITNDATCRIEEKNMKTPAKYHSVFFHNLCSQWLDAGTPSSFLSCTHLAAAGGECISK